MIYTTRVRKTNQAWQEKYCVISEIIRNNIEFHVAGFSKTKKSILNYLLNTHYIFKGSLYFRQDTIADAVGCERETVNRLLLELEEENFIVSNYRHKTSCLYKISRTLYDPFIQSRLGHIFSVLRDRSELLAPATMYKNVTQCINKKYIDIKRDISRVKFDVESLCGVLRKNEYGISMVLRDLNFTLQEKIRASAFPDCALQYAKERLKATAKNPIAYFFKLCFNFCEGYGIKPNWGWSNKLKDLHALKATMENKQNEENLIKKLHEVHAYEDYLYEKQVEEEYKKSNYYSRMKGNITPIYRNSPKYVGAREANTPDQPKYVDPINKPRNPDGISPANIDHLKPPEEKLILYNEFIERIARMKIDLLKLGVSEEKIEEKAQEMRDKQNAIYSQLTHQEKMLYKQQQTIFDVPVF